MECEKTKDLLSEYIDGRLPVDEAAAIAAHLEDCRGCREVERELRATISLVARLAGKEAPEGFAEGVSAALERRMLLEPPPVGARRWRWAAWSFGGISAAAAAVVLAILIVHGPREGRLEHQVQTDTGIQVALREKRADEFSRIRIPTDAPPDVELRGDGIAEAPAEYDDRLAARHDDMRERLEKSEVADHLMDPGRQPDRDRYAALASAPPVIADSIDEPADILAYKAAEGLQRVLREAADISESPDGPAAGEAVERDTPAPMDDAWIDKQLTLAPPEALPGQEPQPVQMEFYSEQSALLSTAVFANNFLAPESRVTRAESTPETLTARLEGLSFQVLELSDERAVLHGRLEPVRILLNNFLLVEVSGLTQSGETPEEIVSQVDAETLDMVQRHHPVALGEPMHVQYIFVRRSAKEPAAPQDVE